MTMIPDPPRPPSLPRCDVQLVLYKFQTAQGLGREVVVLTSRNAGDPMDLQFLNDSFGGPLNELSWIDRPWIEKLWFPKVLIIDGKRVS